MGPEELRNLTGEELREREKQLRKELLDIRVQQISGRVENPGRIRHAKKELARLLTLLREGEG